MSRLIYALLAMVTILVPFQFDVYIPAFPALVEYFDTDEASIQVTLTASLIGMATAQLVMGPISDLFGRRGPMLVTLLAYVLSSLACIFSPSVEVMTVARFILGFSASSGFVMVNAYIRDVSSNKEAPRRFATMVTINGVGPLVAPLVGGQLLFFGEWQIVFVFLALLGSASLISIFLKLPESLPREKRSAASLSSLSSNAAIILSDRQFLIPAFVWALTFSTAASFIAGSPFALQRGFNLTETEYTYLFAFSNLMLLTANLVNRRLLKRFRPVTMLRYGMAQASLAASLLILIAVLDFSNLFFTIGVFALGISVMGFVGANATSLALTNHKERAGFAAGLFGFSAFFFASLIAPMTGVFFGANVSGLSTVMAISLGTAAIVGFSFLRHHEGSVPAHSIAKKGEKP
mgnify:FL=1